MDNIPDVHANDRAIPPGKVLLAEYGSVPAADPWARPVVLDTGRSHLGPTIRLEAIPAGWACAGAMARWDNGCFAVAFNTPEGTRHSTRFRAFEDARARFLKLTA